MNYKQRKWTKDDMKDKTYDNKEYVENTSHKLLSYYADFAKKQRQNEKALCKYCYYINNNRFGGCAMTTVACSLCEKEMNFSSTDTDRLCVDCAKENKMCSHCGAKLD